MADTDDSEFMWRRKPGPKKGPRKPKPPPKNPKRPGRPVGSATKLYGSVLLKRFEDGKGKKPSIDFADEIRKQYDTLCEIAIETGHPNDHQRCFDALMNLAKYVVTKDVPKQEIDITSNGKTMGVAYNFVAAKNPAFDDDDTKA